MQGVRLGHRSRLGLRLEPIAGLREVSPALSGNPGFRNFPRSYIFLRYPISNSAEGKDCRKGGRTDLDKEGMAQAAPGWAETGMQISRHAAFVWHHLRGEGRRMEGYLWGHVSVCVRDMDKTV